MKTQRRGTVGCASVGAGLALLLWLSPLPALGQSLSAAPPPANRFVDPVNGVSLNDAVALAVENEPSFRAAKSALDIARGLRQQAGLRPNPIVSIEHRNEPRGTDNLTTIAVEWPLDLFRQRGRTAVADGEVMAAELAVADHARTLAADVRSRYGEVAAAIRDLAILDELIEVTARQRALLGSRVDEGAATPLDRDMAEVELRRLQSDRLLQEGRTEVALLELKRMLGMTVTTALQLRDSLEALVQVEVVTAPGAGRPANAVDQRADVREAQVRIGIAESKIDRAERSGRFDVGLFASYMRMDSSFPQQAFGAAGGLERVGGLFHYAAAGARVILPVMNRNQGEVAAARAERLAGTAALEATRLTAQTEVAEARIRDDRARQAVRLYANGARALARANFGVVTQSHELGRISLVDVLIEQRRYLDLERAYTDAMRAAYDARTALTRALGGQP